MKNKIVLEENRICEEYTTTNIGVEALALKNHVGKKKIKEILIRNGIKIKKRGAQSLNETFVTSWRENKYNEVEGSHYVVYDPNTLFSSTDIENKSGTLTTYIEKTYGVETPTLYDRRKYYMKYGNYWWEQWLKVRLEQNKTIKKCPYCEWTTIDVDNFSGMFGRHLEEIHNQTIEEYLNNFPQEKTYFRKQYKTLYRKTHLDKEGCSVVCPFCNKKFGRLTAGHMKAFHNMEWDDFRAQYPDVKIMSEENYNQTLDAQKLTNLTVSKKRFISSYEKEIHKILDEYNIEYNANRQILIGKEIDILIPSKNVGIEFDGLKFHTEFFGKKDSKYHLDKTIKCNEKGYGLIHIFEDEYVNHKDIVISKIKHILGLNKELPAVGARNCEVKEIYKYEAEKFLNKNHIQGYSPSTVYVGAFKNEQLVGVMTFKNGSVKNTGWELTRFATDIQYRCPGIGGKLFKYFIKKYNPDSIYSFADRRWTIDINNNVYTKLGFEIERINKPDYRYYNERVDRFKRIHKMTMNKKLLSKKYGFPLTMTELEMTRELGYDRIWDCGLIKYVYYNEKTIE